MLFPRLRLSCVMFLGVLVCYTLSFLFNVEWEPFGWLGELESKTYDVRMKLRRAPRQSGQVVIVDADQKTLDQVGAWPLSRAVYADALDRLAADGARVVAFDILFAEPFDSPVLGIRAARDAYLHEVPAPARRQQFLARLNDLEAQQDGDARFAEALRRTRIGVLAYTLGLRAPALAAGHADPKALREFAAFSRAIMRPQNGLRRAERAEGCLPQFADAAAYRLGFIATFPDADGVARGIRLALAVRGLAHAPLAVQAASVYLRQQMTMEAGVSNVVVQLGPVRLRGDWRGNYLIDYAGRAGSFPYFSLADVARGRFQPGTFRGKAVIVGTSLPGLHDYVPTPVQQQNFPGVELHANALDAILSQRVIYNGRREALIDLLAIALLAFFLPAFLFDRAFARLSATGLGTLLVLLGVDLAAFSYAHMWLNVVMPVFVVLCYSLAAIART